MTSAMRMRVGEARSDSAPVPRVPLHFPRGTKYRTVSGSTRRLREQLAHHLEEGETDEVIAALDTYYVDGDVKKFARTLRLVLDTVRKRQLIHPIRARLAGSDVDSFDRQVRINCSPSSLPMSRYKTIGTLSRGTAERSRRSANDVVKVHAALTPGSRGYGFSIRGGSEYKLGIYVSSVDGGSVAEEEGLVVGDLIMEVNDISFHTISHRDAVQIIKTARRLDLVICQVGRIPKTFVVHQKYSWVDPQGRLVSPPTGHTAELEDSQQMRTSFMLDENNEKKINLVVDVELGLVIRGGQEFGLGIYISGVESKSVADVAGLKVGDQILDVNGKSFMDIEHQEAVRILHYSKHMMMTIKMVGCVPLTRTVTDHTEWMYKEQLERISDSYSDAEGSTTAQNLGFLKGAGSQLTLNSLARQQWTIISERARHLLNKVEQQALFAFLEQYQTGTITVSGLASSLFRLLNTSAKFSLLSEVRSIVQPKDLDEFDTMVLKREMDSLKISTHFESVLSDSYSKYSAPTTGKNKTRTDWNKNRGLFSRFNHMKIPLRLKTKKERKRTLHREKVRDSSGPSEDSGVDSAIYSRVITSVDTPVGLDGALSTREQSHELHGTFKAQRAKKHAELKQKYGDIPLELVTVYKTKPTLGLAIEGGSNTKTPLPRVISIQPGGSAYESGRLQVNHVILEVNNCSLVGLKHSETAKMIASAFKDEATDQMNFLVTESGVQLDINVDLNCK